MSVNNGILSVEVKEYYLLDDTAYYQNHVYILQIFMEQNEYKLNRSYASFLELNQKLRRQYPRSNLPTLPLAGVEVFGKPTGRRFSLLSSASNSSRSTPAAKESQKDIRASLVADSFASVDITKKSLTKRIDTSEVIPQRKTALTDYLNDLLHIPEVLISDTFLHFLDEESIDGDIVPEFSEEILQQLEVTLLLQDEVPGTKIISKELTLPLSVYAGSVIAWSFQTQQHDIGFSVVFDGQDVVAYQRFNSHEKPIRGQFTVPKNGAINLNWDNSYSKWRSKSISFVVRIVDPERYAEVQTQANEIRREKLQLYRQRLTLKRVLNTLSQKILTHGSSSKQQEVLERQSTSSSSLLTLLTIAGEGDIIKHEDTKHLHKQIEQLQNEKLSLSQALGAAETALVQERTACAQQMQQCEDLVVSKDMLDGELQETRNEADMLRTELNDMIAQQQQQKQALKASEEESQPASYTVDELLTLPRDEASRPAVALTHFNALLEHTKVLHQHHVSLRQQFTTLQKQSSKWKTAKQQLKAAAISLKERSELAEAEIQRMQHERLLMIGEMETLQAKQRSYENQLRLIQQENREKDDEIKHLRIMREKDALQRKALQQQCGQQQQQQDGESGDKKDFSQDDYVLNTIKEIWELRPRYEDDDNNNAAVEAETSEQPGKIVVHDFSQEPPDEISAMLENMTSSLMEMMPSWTSFTGNDDSNTVGDDGDSSENSSHVSQQQQQAQPQQQQPQQRQQPRGQSMSSNSSGESSNSNKWSSALRNMSFGF
jgi:hypothetical protein